MPTPPPSDLRHVLRDLAAIRRVVVDHIHTGLKHPDPAAQVQARSLATEMDAAGLNVDRDVDALASPQPTDAGAKEARVRAEGIR